MKRPDHRLRIVPDVIRHPDVAWRVAGPTGRTAAGAMFAGRWRQCTAALPLCMGRAVNPEPHNCTCSEPPMLGLTSRWFEPAEGQPANERPERC